MCGIFGLYLIEGTDPDLGDRAAAAAKLMEHRGRDRFGLWHNGRAALAVNQFKIFRADENRQPVTAEDGSVVAVCNGEIYNHRELSQRLRSAGHVVFAASDTEVLPHLYEEDGDAFPESLRGDFAAAIYDAGRHRLVLARDRLGVKPLYLAHFPGGFAFASEIKAFAGLPGFEWRLDEQAIWHFLSYGYVPSGISAIRDVERIAAGTVVVLGGAIATRRTFWDVPPLTCEEPDLQTAAAEVRRRFKDALAVRLQGDLPVGLLLSGGTDSGLLLHLLAAMDRPREPIHTYCARFAENGFDEGERAARMARRFGTIHHEIPISPDLVRDLPRVVWHQDGLQINAPSLVHLAIARQAREHSPILLSGEGGDEVFLGYETYKATEYVSRFGRFARYPARLLAGPALRVPPIARGPISLDYRVAHFLAGLGMDPLRAHVFWREYFHDDQKRALTAPRFGASFPAGSEELFFGRYAARGGDDLLDRASYGDLKLWLTDNSLCEVDTAAMAHMVEVRVPFLDEALVEYVASLPTPVRYPGGRPKGLLAAAFSGEVGAELFAMRKRHLSVPLRHWFAGPLSGWLAETLAPERLAPLGLFDPAAVRTFVDQHVRRRADHGRRLWLLVNLVTWHEVFIQGRRPATP